MRKKCKSKELILREEATERIAELLTALLVVDGGAASDTQTPATFLIANQTALNFYTEKLVTNILAYCNREDFPEPLIFTAVDLLCKQFTDMFQAAESENGTSAPISEIKQDDTSFKFAVNAVDVSVIASEQFFDRLKPNLNLYRKPKSL